MTRPTIDRYRLSSGDEVRIIEAIRRADVAWGEKRPIPAEFVDTLERLAAHAIGCSLFDLRDSEREWIANVISELSATTPLYR